MLRPSLALALLCTPALPADEPAPRIRVLALDGRILEGRAYEARGTRLIVKAASGEAALDLADVLEAHVVPPAASGSPSPGGSPSSPAVAVEFVNGDVLRGLLVKGLGEEGFVVRSAALDEVAVSLERVAALRFTAGYARTDDPPELAAPEKADRVLFVTGDRIDGTLRSIAPGELRLRDGAGSDRILKPEALLGFALAPLPREPETGLRVQLALADGSRLTGTGVATGPAGWTLTGMVDGKGRTLPHAAVEGLSVRGGRGTPLGDLPPSGVEVRPYWGDDPPVLRHRPRFDRAFTLDRGAPPPLRLGGRTYLRGVSSFSGTTMTWALDGKGFRSFVAAVGVDDAGPKGAVEFEVLLDGKSAWKSGVVRALAPGGEPVPVPRLDVSAAKTLSLVVHPGPEDDVQDFADWVRAVLLP